MEVQLLHLGYKVLEVVSLSINTGAIMCPSVTMGSTYEGSDVASWIKSVEGYITFNKHWSYHVPECNYG